MANMVEVIEPFYPKGEITDGPIRWRPCCVFLHAALVQPERRCHGRCPHEIASMRLFARFIPG